MSKVRSICIMLAFSAPAMLWAQQQALPPTLQEVVVTANRFLQKQDQTGKVVTVITDSILRLNAGRSLADMLNQQAGIYVADAAGSPGSMSDLYMRGTATGNTLLLLDGMPLSDVSSIRGTFDLNQLPLEMIERVEILKGAQSTVYGSDAVAGVINIITRKPMDTPLGISGSVAGGSYGTLNISAGASGKINKGSYSIQYLNNRSHGFSSATDSTGKSGYDRDGIQQQAVRAQFVLPIGNTIKWTTSGQWGRYKNDLDIGAFQDEGDYREVNDFYRINTGLTWETEHGSVHVSYSHERDQRNYLDDSIYRSPYITFSTEHYAGRSNIGEAYGNLKLSDNFQLLIGMDHRWQNTDQYYYSIGPYGSYETSLSSDSSRIRISSAYASVFLKKAKKIFLEAGGRYNIHSRYGGGFTFTLNPSMIIAERLKIFMNISSAFKAPSLYQLYDPVVGSPTLKAETTISGEAGLQWSSPDKKWNGRAVAFARKTTEGIDYSFVDNKYFNNNRQKDHGAELEASFHGRRWNGSAAYSYVTGMVNTIKYKTDPNTFESRIDGDTTYSNLFRRPKNNLVLQAGYRISGKWSFSMTCRLTGKRYEPRFSDTPITLKPYEVTDIFISRDISKRFHVYFDLRNIFDTRYSDVLGFNTRGRNVMAGIRYNI